MPGLPKPPSYDESDNRADDDADENIKPSTLIGSHEPHFLPAPVLRGHAWARGSVPEVIEDGMTSFVVESEAQAVAAIGRIHRLDRGRIRERFEQRTEPSR